MLNMLFVFILNFLICHQNLQTDNMTIEEIQRRVNKYITEQNPTEESINKHAEECLLCKTNLETTMYIHMSKAIKR